MVSEVLIPTDLDNPAIIHTSAKILRQAHLLATTTRHPLTPSLHSRLKALQGEAKEGTKGGKNVNKFTQKHRDPHNRHSSEAKLFKKSISFIQF